MRYALLCLMAILFFCAPLNAQSVTDFKLGDYKYRTSGYQSLLLDANLGSNAGGGKSVGDRRTDLMLNGYARMQQISVFATDKKQHLSSLTGFFQSAGIAQKLAANKTSGKAFGTFFDYKYLDRLYLNKFFIEYGGSAFLNYDFSHEKRADSTFSRNGYGATISPSIGVGTGRLEQVSDAQTAVFILEALYKSRKISRVDSELTNQFARLITALRNKRLFDLRRRSINQIMQIDSFLRVNRLIAGTDAETVALVYDNLYFAFNNDLSFLPGFFHSHESSQYIFDSYNAYIPNQAGQVFTADNGFDIYARNYSRFIDEFEVQTLQSINEQTPRLSGNILYARLSGLAGHRKLISEQEKQTLIDKRITVGYEKHIPVNLQWQKSFSGMLAFRSANENPVDPFFSPYTNRYWFNGKYRLGYYPSNRTSVEGYSDLSLSLNKTNKTSQSVPIGKAFSGGVGAGLIGTYFLNFRTVLKGSVAAGYSKILSNSYPNGGKDGYLSFGFAIRILHYFY